MEIYDEVNDQIIVDTINILMSTNIPGQADVSLTSKTLVGTSTNAAKYNEYPYITQSIAIKEGYLRNKSFNDILDYFFIKDIFVKKTNEMRANIRKIIKNDGVEKNIEKPKTDEDEEKEEKDEEEKEKAKEKEEEENKKKTGGTAKMFGGKPDTEDKKPTDCIKLDNLKSNIQLLLRMIFDTYPINGNVTSSLNPEVYTTKLYNLNKYSHLNISGKPYTVSKIIWVNDIYNHYTSKQLLKDYKEFNAWRIGEQSNIERSKVDIKRTRDSYINSTKGKKTPLRINLRDDISKIKSYMMNLSNWTNKTQSLITIRNALEIFYAHLIPIIYKSNARIEDRINELILDKETLSLDQKKNIEPELRDQQQRIDNIISILKRSLKGYTIEKTPEYVTELNRTANVVINSNILSISSGVKNFIKDLNENNEKRIILENNENLIGLPTAIFGNEKYKDANYKTLTDAISKDIKTLKKIVNIKKNEFSVDSIRSLVKNLQMPTKPKPADDETGIIYDNNNVTTPKYEIYAYVDLIEGKITDDNKNSLDLCTFRDELLLIKFNQLINDETSILQHDPLIKLLDSKPDAPKQEVKLKVGGNTKKNRLFYNVNNRTKKYE